MRDNAVKYVSLSHIRSTGHTTFRAYGITIAMTLNIKAKTPPSSPGPTRILTLTLVPGGVGQRPIAIQPDTVAIMLTKSASSFSDPLPKDDCRRPRSNDPCTKAQQGKALFGIWSFPPVS
jgi:hypothetical protein